MVLSTKELTEIFGWKSRNDPLFLDGASTLEINEHRFLRATSLIGDSSGKSVLDIGSYPGYAINYFGPNYTACGLLPKDYIEKIESIGMDSLETNVEESVPEISADIVLFQEVIEHLRRPHQALKNISESMTYGAQLYLTTNNIFYYGYIAKLLARRPILDAIETEGSLYPGHERYYSLNELAKSLENLGFKIESAENINLLPPVRYYRNKKLGAAKKILSVLTPRGYSSHIELLATKM